MALEKKINPVDLRGNKYRLRIIVCDHDSRLVKQVSRINGLYEILCPSGVGLDKSFLEPSTNSKRISSAGGLLLTFKEPILVSTAIICGNELQ